MSLALASSFVSSTSALTFTLYRPRCRQLPTCNLQLFINRLTFFRPLGTFTKQLRFCYYGAARDIIGTSCNGGWEFNFDLFGGNNETENTIKIFNYFLNAPDSQSSNLYLNFSNVPAEFESFDPNPIYIPGEEGNFFYLEYSGICCIIIFYHSGIVSFMKSNLKSIKGVFTLNQCLVLLFCQPF